MLYGGINVLGRIINVFYEDGREPTSHTMDEFDSLKKDKNVWYIIDDETGDVLFDNDAEE